jgi:alginate O-acetyltransferase complex protein AlgI
VLRWSAVHLPIGISFYTFHALSYVIDVYRKETPVQRRLDLLMLYIALFPQLIAGPIVRYHDVAKQLLRRNLDIAGIVSGLRRFTEGLAKKTILANPMGATADTIFALNTEQLSPGTAWIGLISYTLQIYFDFSGYSDMAIGLARVFGFEFPENFNYPYVAQTLSDFWRRWHISLSTWLRDYLYIPLGGNRLSLGRTYLNLCVVFLLCGLWHGASWSFVLWGGLHGAVLVLERVGLARLLAVLPRPARTLSVLGVVAIGWVLFRCETLADAGHYFGAMFGRSGSASAGYGWQAYLTPYMLVVWVVGVVAATPLIATRYTRVVDASAALAQLAPGFCHVLVHSALFVIAVAHLAAGTHNPFIYFRF